MKIIKIIGFIVCAYLLLVIAGNIWTQIWVQTDKKGPMTDTERKLQEKISLGHTGKLQINDRIWLAGGYEPEPEWLGKTQGYYGSVESFMPGQNSEPAVIVKLDSKITVEKITGDILIMELRWEGAKWGNQGVVHLELCDFVPEHKPWKNRKQGKWIESHASYKKI